MELQLLTPELWLKERKRLLGFAVRFGEKRLTVAAVHALRLLEPSLLAEMNEAGAPEAVIAVAKLNGRIAGIGFASGGGERGSFFVVHPDARRLGIGSALVRAMIDKLSSFTCNVAIDNVASMRLCFQLGLTAVSLHTGPTGKPTLRFERRINDDAASTRNIDALSK
ncbi:GNAT family N-acetyltransferase [Paenibacillus sp. NEAU-GSW1]|uniref:GNAT family N-acetyltransferase n=1 Tax=Paenibacillus sp. NEAU-GSW1 TaxID=2682486 RepID=UPI0012E321BF|nr:GNAT family N-acetyltransferase [Paenibacillus sp. NEAU-GSW1]MUT64450.1 GNAT family N-acetyltransferase [Paenibacillus sp. NEAU-GSW1]